MVREIFSKNAKRICFHGTLTKTFFTLQLKQVIHESRLARDISVIMCRDYGMT